MNIGENYSPVCKAASIHIIVFVLPFFLGDKFEVLPFPPSFCIPTLTMPDSFFFYNVKKMFMRESDFVDVVLPSNELGMRRDCR